MSVWGESRVSEQGGPRELSRLKMCTLTFFIRRGSAIQRLRAIIQNKWPPRASDKKEQPLYALRICIRARTQ